MKAYDIIIIGAGPGGIFAAYELMKQKPDLKVAVFEAGHMLNKRKCPIDGVTRSRVLYPLQELFHYERFRRSRSFF